LKGFRWYALVVASLTYLFGCGGGDGGDTGLQQITFIDKGAVSPAGITTKVSIDQNQIECNQDSSAGGTAWIYPAIQPADFTSLQEIVADYHLFESGDVTVSTGQQPSTGWKGMTVTMIKSNGSHSFEISGDMADRTQWPAGVRELVDFQDALVAKYGPLTSH
jgi:hypothetical protein